MTPQPNDFLRLQSRTDYEPARHRLALILLLLEPRGTVGLDDPLGHQRLNLPVFVVVVDVVGLW